VISPRYLLRCGCCDDEALQIHYGPDGLEINGVYGSIENWREILLPLLGISRHGKTLRANPIRRKMLKPASKRKGDAGEMLTPKEAKLVRGAVRLSSNEASPNLGAV
jgi:hypothetical protein